MAFKRVVLGVGAFGLGLVALFPGVANAAVETGLSIAGAAPQIAEQHASVGVPMALGMVLAGVVLRRNRAWYSDPQLAERLMPLPQDYTYLPPR